MGVDDTLREGGMAAARRNAFLRGFGGLFSWVDVLNRRLFAESAAEADAEAIRGYWEATGGYLYDAMGIYEKDCKVYVTRRRAQECQTPKNDQNLTSE